MPTSRCNYPKCIGLNDGLCPTSTSRIAPLFRSSNYGGTHRRCGEPYVVFLGEDKPVPIMVSVRDRAQVDLVRRL